MVLKHFCHQITKILCSKIPFFGLFIQIVTKCDLQSVNLSDSKYISDCQHRPNNLWPVAELPKNTASPTHFSDNFVEHWLLSIVGSGAYVGLDINI